MEFSICMDCIGVIRLKCVSLWWPYCMEFNIFICCIGVIRHIFGSHLLGLQNIEWLKYYGFSISEIDYFSCIWQNFRNFWSSLFFNFVLYFVFLKTKDSEMVHCIIFEMFYIDLMYMCLEVVLQFRIMVLLIGWIFITVNVLWITSYYQQLLFSANLYCNIWYHVSYGT